MTVRQQSNRGWSGKGTAPADGQTGNNAGSVLPSNLTFKRSQISSIEGGSGAGADGGS